MAHIAPKLSIVENHLYGGKAGDYRTLPPGTASASPRSTWSGIEVGGAVYTAASIVTLVRYISASYRIGFSLALIEGAQHGKH